MLNREEGLECEVHIDGIRLENVSELKYLDELGTDEAECSRKVAGAISSLVNAMDLQLECTRVVHETLLVPVLMYGNETMLWKEKEISRIRTVQMDNLRGLLGIRTMDKGIKEFYGVRSGSAMWRGWRAIGLSRESL